MKKATKGWVGAALFTLAVLAGGAVPAAALSADSLRQDVSRLASHGRMDDALTLVEKNEGALPASWNAMFHGKLELDGEKSFRGYKDAADDSSPPQMRGEAVFRQGQYHYAAGRYHLAIPQFRGYLAKYPDGVWSEASYYWIAYSCIQFVKQRPGKEAYLDTAQAYLRKLEFRGKSGYYWPLARAAQGRVLLMRGDTVGAVRALGDARRKAPAEEVPGILLLSLQVEKHGASAGAWEDSLRWGYPLAPETRLLGPGKAASTRPAAAKGAYALQLGVFSKRENAERLQRELADKKVDSRIEPLQARDRELFRVLHGGFANSSAAAEQGRKVLKPLGYEFRVTGP